MPLRRELDIPVNPACQSPNRSDLWPCQQRLGVVGGAARALGGCDSHPEPRTCSTCNGAGRRRDVYFDRIAHLLFTVDTRLHIPPRARVSGVRGAGHTRFISAPVRREPPFSLCFPRGRAHTVPRPAATSHTLRCSHTLHGLPYVHTFARPCCCAPVGLPALCPLPSMLPQASPVA